jgi:hypothetical protein
MRLISAFRRLTLLHRLFDAKNSGTTDIGAPRRSLQFLKRRPERLFERRAFVGFQCLLRHEDGHELRFCYLEESSSVSWIYM